MAASPCRAARWTMALRSDGDIASKRRASSMPCLILVPLTLRRCCCGGSFVFSRAPNANKTSNPPRASWPPVVHFRGFLFRRPRLRWTVCGSSAGASCLSLLLDHRRASGASCCRAFAWLGFLSAVAPFGSARPASRWRVGAFFARFRGSSLAVAVHGAVRWRGRPRARWPFFQAKANPPLALWQP